MHHKGGPGWSDKPWQSHQPIPSKHPKSAILILLGVWVWFKSIYHYKHESDPVCQCYESSSFAKTEQESNRKTEEKHLERQLGLRYSVFSITCLWILWKKKNYHSLCRATALVNNPSLGATSESQPGPWPDGYHVSSRGGSGGGCWKRKDWGEEKEGERGEEVEGYPGLLLHHRFSTTYRMLPGWVSRLHAYKSRNWTGTGPSSLFCHTFLESVNNVCSITSQILEHALRKTWKNSSLHAF